ncbi:PREDICTED: odorant receptor 46a-like [Trachymyrmex cornetzi]|uniref:odorant receptor 46a-like n=1 Tax=Trachymyrmex cornetzi TaxID=471704 RepID=UPI00084F7359|nr:PREDICTED: odorant receptor 46a-like [Trachymyrmex cornetzi]
MVNRRFAKIIALQFAVSMLVVCANLYKLASISIVMINGSLVTLIMYTACMLSQIFLYCWFGNELKLKSIGVANSIYNMKWHVFNNKNKKALLLIMRRSMVPIEFNSAVIITLNLDSFVSLLKSSYSAYNLLNDVQEAQMLKFSLMLCAIAACWQPITWTSLCKHIIYKTYAIFLISSLYLFLFSQFINITLNVGNSDEFTDALYMMLTIFVAGYKQVYMWVDRKNFMIIINIFNEKPFAPYETHEVMIQQKFEKLIQNNMRRYLIIVLMSIGSIVTMSVSTDFMKRNLTYKAWIPFDYSSPAIYFVVYIHQLIAMSTSGIVNVACESLLCGFLLHICCQFEILGYRLTKLTHDQNSLRDCVRHHNCIFEYAYTVNNMFAKIIAIQFAVSMLVVCSNLYRIAMARDYVSFIPLIMYTSAILVQIFIYCWFGNEVKLKSLQLINSIYDIEWLALSNSNKKDLLLIMKRAMTPIEFTSGYIITMNLESFVALLKMSYSVFNLLHQTNE